MTLPCSMSWTSELLSLLRAARITAGTEMASLSSRAGSVDDDLIPEPLLSVSTSTQGHTNWSAVSLSGISGLEPHKDWVRIPSPCCRCCRWCCVRLRNLRKQRCNCSRAKLRASRTSAHSTSSTSLCWNSRMLAAIFWKSTYNHQSASTYTITIQLPRESIVWFVRDN